MWNFEFIYTKIFILIWSQSDLEVDCKMRYLTLTSDSSKYRCVSVGDTIVLSWTVHHDFTNISDIGISSIRFSGFAKSQKQKGHDIMVPINSNLITRTVMNPKRNILSLRIPRNNTVAECQLNMSRLTVYIFLIMHIFRYSRSWRDTSRSNRSVFREYIFTAGQITGNNCNI